MDFREYLEFAKAHTTELLESYQFEKANAFIMESSLPFLRENAGEFRKDLFENLFSVAGKGYRTQYQRFDFECADYELYRFSSDTPLVRGPRPALSDIQSGNYFTVIGAAQFFGRYQAEPLHKLISKRYKIPALNLSEGGAGPKLFLEREPVVSAANGSRFVLLQVLSGRSVGCEEYPGERLTIPANDPGAPRRERLAVLTDIWKRDVSEARRLVAKWSENYVRAYKDLIKRIGRPVILVWVSARSPDDWSPNELSAGPKWGLFPQLVSRAMVTEIAKECAYYVEGLKDGGLPYKVFNRATGAECPFFEPDGRLSWANTYYTSRLAHAALFRALEPHVSKLV
ncbi:MAG: DUF6473 family protein [Roseiarcus sp.]